MNNIELLTVFISAMAPIIELRGAIPLAILKYDIPPVTAYLISVAGNLVPVIPILLFLHKATDRLISYIPKTEKVFDWVFKRTRNKSGLIEKYELLGLALFVALPLPGTGAWTGTIAAYLFGLDYKKSFASICVGVLIAGVLVTILSLGIKTA